MNFDTERGRGGLEKKKGRGTALIAQAPHKKKKNEKGRKPHSSVKYLPLPCQRKKKKGGKEVQKGRGDRLRLTTRGNLQKRKGAGTPFFAEGNARRMERHRRGARGLFLRCNVSPRKERGLSGKKEKETPEAWTSQFVGGGHKKRK